jgi:hypothetical protein
MKRLTLGIFVLVFLVGAAHTTWAACRHAHNVNSKRPMYLTDATTMKKYDRLKGCVIVSWLEMTPHAFVHAKVWTGTDSFEFLLVSVGSSSSSEISGKFNIYKNGVLVANGVAGKVYGINQTAGSGHYFKFYAGTGPVYQEKWHFSFYLDYRFDCMCKRMIRKQIKRIKK